MAKHATLTARDFFLAYFYTSGPFTCIFSKTSPDFSLCWLWLTHGSCVGPQNKIGHLLDAGSHTECPRNINRLKKNPWLCGMMTCGMTNLEIESPQWGAADAEIKVPSGENTELKRSPFQAWSKSIYSHACYAYCHGFLSCLFLHFRSIHLHFFQNLSRFFPVLAVANTWFLCRPAE